MPNPDPNTVLPALQHGDLSLKGQFLWGSNYTFLALINYENTSFKAVYKPTRGERPLWDFPAASLAGREVAAYEISESLKWHLVPPTVYRQDGPHGPGSVQLFIEHDAEYHYFNFREADRQRLRPVVLFDILANNADRKGSHVLLDADSHLWLIDHGICFHVEDKLRTVIWDFSGEIIPEPLCADLSRLREKLQVSSRLVQVLQQHLSDPEIQAIGHRLDRLLSAGRFPNPSPSYRPTPWPPV